VAKTSLIAVVCALGAKLPILNKAPQFVVMRPPYATKQSALHWALSKNLEGVAIGPQLNRPEHAVHCHCLAGRAALSVFRDDSQRPDP
jgi:hypothetical protein